MILFYDHLIDKSEVLLLIESLSAPEDKKTKFKNLVDDILHTGLTEFILQKLHPHQHRTFLAQLEKAPYDPELIVFLRQQTNTDIENLIRSEAQRILKLITKDLTNTDLT